MENILVLRYVELRSQLHRLISVLKVRQSAYDTAIREFVITERGMQVADTFATAEAVLTGVDRLRLAHLDEPTGEQSSPPLGAYQDSGRGRRGDAPRPDHAGARGRGPTPW